MINQRWWIERSNRGDGGGGGGLGEKKTAHRCTFVRSIYHLIPPCRWTFNVGVYASPSRACTTTLLSLIPAKERARRRNRATRIRNNRHGTHHQVQAKKRKKKKEAWWLAGSTILVWMTANDFPPRFPVADSRGLWPKCRLTRAH